MSNTLFDAAPANAVALRDAQQVVVGGAPFVDSGGLEHRSHLEEWTMTGR
jgi:hypothetical protein